MSASAWPSTAAAGPVGAAPAASSFKPVRTVPRVRPRRPACRPDQRPSLRPPIRRALEATAPAPHICWPTLASPPHDAEHRNTTMQRDRMVRVKVGRRSRGLDSTPQRQGASGRMYHGRFRKKRGPQAIGKSRGGPLEHQDSYGCRGFPRTAVALGFGQIQQVAVRASLPAALSGEVNRMFAQQLAQGRGGTVIEKYPQNLSACRSGPASHGSRD